MSEPKALKDCKWRCCIDEGNNPAGTPLFYWIIETEDFNGANFDFELVSDKVFFTREEAFTDGKAFLKRNGWTNVVWEDGKS